MKTIIDRLDEAEAVLKKDNNDAGRMVTRDLTHAAVVIAQNMQGEHHVQPLETIAFNLFFEQCDTLFEILAQQQAARHWAQPTKSVNKKKQLEAMKDEVYRNRIKQKGRRVD